jgi:hypothetical protein
MPKARRQGLPKHIVMDRWLDLLKDEPPRMVDTPILYHYTDAFGAQGIISSNSLWATATQFSNDLSEIEYSVPLAIDVIADMWGKKKMTAWESVLIQHLLQLLDTPLHTFGQPFIVSFCEDGDLLSQWRGYGGGSGFSLAFSPLHFRNKVKLVAQSGFRTMVKKVEYEPEKQRERLRFLLKHLATLVNGFTFPATSPQGIDAHVELSLILILEITDWACSVKHSAFKEENEWRVITYPKGATLVGETRPNYGGISVRPTSRLLLPYMVLRAPTGKHLPLLEVRCGPSQFQEQSARAMKILLRKHGYGNVTVALSDVPLRV